MSKKKFPSPSEKFDFRALGQAIKKARTDRNESRKEVCDDLFFSPRFLANIENVGSHPSLQLFYELVTRYNISVDQFFYPDVDVQKSTHRRYLDELLEKISDEKLRYVIALVEEIYKSENE